MLRAVVAYLRDPVSAGLYLQGRPGVGMSTVLASVAARARRRKDRLITISASHAERDVPFAGLHQMLHACRRLVAARPAIEVLSTAVGGAVDSGVLAATASLLGVIAADGPALIVVDGAHRLDPQTSEAMAGALGRAPVAGLAVVLGGHPAGATAWPGLPTWTLPGLPAPAARRLLQMRAPGLNPWLADRILDEAAGRPLALAELPEAWADRTEPGADLLVPHAPLTTRLARSLLEETRSLPAGAAGILLLVAGGQPWQPARLATAARHLIGSSSIGTLVAAGWLTDGSDGVRLTDPLLAAALLQTAAADQLRPSVEGLNDFGDPGDLPVASGVRALRRALMSVRAGQRGERAGRGLVDGAEVAADLGRFEVVAALLGALPERINPIDAARQDILLRRIGESAWGHVPSVEAVCAVADTCRAAGNPSLALDLLAGFAATVTWSDVDEVPRRRFLASLDELEDHQRDPRWLLVCATADPARAGGGGAQVSGLADDSARWHVGLAMRRLGRLESAAELLSIVVPSLSGQHRFGALLPAAAALADVQFLLGRWDSAEEQLRRAGVAAERTDQTAWLAHVRATTAMLHAARGEAGAARSRAEAAERALGDRPVWPVRLRVAAARATALMGEGRFAEACVELEPMLTRPGVRAYTVDLAVVATLYAEAAGRGDPRPERPAVLAAVQEALHANPSSEGDAHLDYLRILLQPPPDVERTWIALLDRAGRLPWLQARARLGYGSWLRREQRVAEAREQLHRAAAVFATLRAGYWSERTAQELRAAGIAQPDGRPLSGLLSPQELAVVQLAATGLSNREIGARLALSPRTVGSHLARAFPKLAVTSRHQLPARLQELT
ncbi:helix-turn-helix transcriptional regulator [Dactylosporangium siamense]|uniref:helix-turn-helix transcriptional regulator n=1 Tax=Dactylosporangium siamense TaxID=685454 RepID=UPI001943D29A|nr:LuxR C-terminal-related transcriptional regulator [Dactylosporangium siamense]